MVRLLLCSAAIGATLISPAVEAKLLELTFFGEVTGYQNDAGAYWDDSRIGQAVTGRYLINSDTDYGGREETRWFWWWDIDGRQGPGAMTVDLRVGESTYRIGNEHEFYDAGEEAWHGVNEFITFTNGPDFDEAPIPDALSLLDSESSSVEVGSSETFTDQTVEIAFHDYINDILDMNPLVQEFEWRDEDGNGDQQNGTGTLRAFRSGQDYDSGIYQVIYDGALEFRLSQVSAKFVKDAAVPEPSGLLLALTGGLVWLARRRSHSVFPISH